MSEQDKGNGAFLREEEEDDDFNAALNQMGFSEFEAPNITGTKHAADAMDFSDEDELADEEEEQELNDGKQDDDIAAQAGGDIESEDDLLNELAAEAKEGVDEDEDGMDGMLGDMFGTGSGLGGGLHDLGFENEADEDDLDIHHEMGIGASHEDDGLVGESDIDDVEMDDDSMMDEEERKKQQEALKEEQRKKREEQEQIKRKKLLQIYYPTFAKGKPLKMQSLFPIEPYYYSYQEPMNTVKPLIPTKIKLEPELDQRIKFKKPHAVKKQQDQSNGNSISNTMSGNTSSGIASYPETEQRIITISNEVYQNLNPSKEVVKKPKKETLETYDKDLILSVADWDDKHIFMGEPGDSDTESVISSSGTIAPSRKKMKIENMNYDDWEVDDEMIFEGTIDLQSLNLKLDMNDKNMLFVNADDGKQQETSTGQLNQAVLPLNEKMIELRFSISNDKEYDLLKKHYQSKVRATIGNLNIDHSLPAIRLQSPYYKVTSDAKEIRQYHRSNFPIRKARLVFTKIKTRKRKKDKGKEVSELFGKTTDLTLGDSAPFFMLEYSEENPPVLNSFGMGSKLINYYRKRGEDDNSRPKLSVGETHVLGVEDRSPFWNFGFVEPGTIVPTLYNRMIRAPVFKHDPLTTDFLLIRSSGGGSSPRYFIRTINNVFTVGQTLPVVDVPGPNSRKVTTTAKNRLRMVAYRVLNHNPDHRLVVKDLAPHFPDQNDMQTRHRLKEFMVYQRQGEDQGFWKMKPTEKLLGKEQTRSMISPEDITLISSMRAGQTLLDDYDSFKRETGDMISAGAGDGSSNALTNEGGAQRKKQEKDSNSSDEPLLVQLAPWNTTRNFINATQGKAMLQIHGEGDPSGKGEAVSFLRTSMKGGFKVAPDLSIAGTPASPAPGTPGAGAPATKEKKSSGHSYNVAMQQKLYDDEISKVWYTQRASLSRSRASDKPREITQDELKDDAYIKRSSQEIDKEIQSDANSANRGHPRIIRITRMVRNAYGILERQTEVVDDPKVVELYIKKRQERLIDDTNDMEPDKLILTNDAEENAKMRHKIQEELARLEKKQEKRKKKAPGITAANIDSEGRISGKGIGKGKSTSRRCATCGELGHIRTNKSCPLYHTIFNKSNPNYVPGSENSIQPEDGTAGPAGDANGASTTVADEATIGQTLPTAPTES